MIAGEIQPLPSSCPTRLLMLILDCWDPDPDNRGAFDGLLRDLIGLALDRHIFSGLEPPPTLNDAMYVQLDQATGKTRYVLFQDYAGQDYAGYELPIDGLEGSGGDASPVGVDDYASPEDQRAASAASRWRPPRASCASAEYAAPQDQSQYIRPLQPVGQANQDAQDGYSAALQVDDVYREAASPCLDEPPLPPLPTLPAALLADDLYSDAANDCVASLDEPDARATVLNGEPSAPGDGAGGSSTPPLSPLYVNVDGHAESGDASALPNHSTMRGPLVSNGCGYALPADSDGGTTRPPSTPLLGTAAASTPSAVTENESEGVRLSSYRRFAQLKTYVNWPLEATPPEPAASVRTSTDAHTDHWYQGPCTPIDVRFEVPPCQPTLVSSKHYVLIRPAGSDREYKVELEDTIESTDAHRISLLTAASCAFQVSSR